MSQRIGSQTCGERLVSDDMPTPETLIPGLAGHPRAELAPLPSAIDWLERLGARLDCTLLAKRDDALALAMGGNKVRQLEYYCGAARAHGADSLLITGAIQSNFVRLTAAAARKLGWLPVVQLEKRVPKDDPAYFGSGNVLLDRLLGAEIHYFDEGENEAAADANLDRLAEDLRVRGRKPFAIHLGIEHPPIGGLGYVRCAAEAYTQLGAAASSITHAVVPSGSGLTHAGFLVGAKALGWNIPVLGVCVRRDAIAQRERVLRRAREVAELIGCPGLIGEDDIVVDDGVLSPGYGRLNRETADAMAFAAQDEAILLDPVYSGRTFAGLMAFRRTGVIGEGAKVLFIHTGGQPALFGYRSDLEKALDEPESLPRACA